MIIITNRSNIGRWRSSVNHVSGVIYYATECIVLYCTASLTALQHQNKSLHASNARRIPLLVSPFVVLFVFYSCRDTEVIVQQPRHALLCCAPWITNPPHVHHGQPLAPPPPPPPPQPSTTKTKLRKPTQACLISFFLLFFFVCKCYSRSNSQSIVEWHLQDWHGHQVTNIYYTPKVPY